MARRERERIGRPGFGIKHYRLEAESGEVRFGDGQDIDAEAIADARKTLRGLQK